jgi:hypothetical protein
MPTAHHIIGLTGHARAGKDSVAAHLVEHYGFGRVAFADALREAALALDPIVSNGHGDLARRVGRDRPGMWGRRFIRLAEVVTIIGWEEAKEFDEVRRTLQRYGVAIRAMDPEFWIRTALAPVAYTSRPVVVTDVRFPNEVDAVRNRGGLFVRVRRPGATGNGHISEHAIDHIAADVDIENTGTLADLGAAVERLIAAPYNLPRVARYNVLGAVRGF